MEFVKRPTAKDTEEDILLLQEQFSRHSSSKPSATIVKKCGVESNGGNAGETLENPPATTVLSEIREKNTNITEFVFRLPKTTIAAKEAAGDVKEYLIDALTVGPGLASDGGNNPADDLRSLQRIVHEENLAKLSKMTEEDVTRAREEIFEKLDPKLVQFLKRRKKEIDQPISTPALQVERRTESDHSPASSQSTDELVVNPTTKWPHMNKPEPEKLAWISSLPEKPSQQDLYTARFDFKGNLVPTRSEIPVHVGLHHHGKEPEAPGYTLEELLRLCRSQAINQRVLAMNTLANIVGLAKSSAYNELLLPISLMRSLMESNICTIMRYALDDMAISVMTAACRLLTAFLHSPSDEYSYLLQMCLDTSYALSLDTSQLALAPAVSYIQEELDEKDDEELCSCDMILGLLRMGTLQRIRYLLEVVQPPSSRFITDVFSILIRIARHSEDACRQVFDCPRLMDVISTSLLPGSCHIQGSNSAMYPSYRVPYWCALKLCRIIVQSCPDLAAVLAEKYQIGDVVAHYVMMEPEDTMIPVDGAYRLAIEAYRLWGEMLANSLCCEHFCDLFPTMIGHLRAAVSLPPGDHCNHLIWNRASSLALSIGKFMSKKGSHILGAQLHLQGILDVVLMALMKLLNERITDAPASYYHLIASLANCCMEAVSMDVNLLSQEQLQTVVQDLVPKFESAFGDRFTRDKERPPRTEVHSLAQDPACLPSLQSVGGGSLIQMIQERSLYPVFLALQRLCRKSTNK